MDLASVWLKGNTAGIPTHPGTMDFSIDTGEPSAEKEIKEDFPMVVGKEACALLKLYGIRKP